MASYGSYKSRHDFTQPQLMTCLVPRSYWKTMYHRVIEPLGVSGALRRAMGLRQLLNYSMLNMFAHRAEVLEVPNATGLETGIASAHYVSLSGRKRKGFVKVSVLVLGGSLVPA